MHLHSFVKYNYQSYFIEFIITALLFRQLFLIDFFILHIIFSVSGHTSSCRIKTWFFCVLFQKFYYQEENEMTLLKCSAHNCCYNKDSLCSKGSISVDGAEARYADDTACESFRSQDECSVKNTMDSGCGCETINIDCKAHNCTHNEHCKCTAASINVSGDNARRCCDTKCDTFDCKC